MKNPTLWGGRPLRCAVLVPIALALLAGSRLAAGSPDSIADTVWRDNGGTNVRTLNTSIFVFRADGTYSSILMTDGDTLDFSHTMHVAPPIDGTYRYTKTGDATAQLFLSSGNGAPSVSFDGTNTLTLTFFLGSTTSGNSRSADGMFFSTFRLSPLPAPGSAPLVNISTRVVARSGAPAIVGFVVGPAENRDVLIRVVGPGLGPLGLPGFWTRPVFQLYAADGTPVAIPGASPAGWSSNGAANVASQQRAWSMTGAFPLASGSADLSEVTTLSPGGYTLVVLPSSGDPGGDVLIEAYTLP